MVDGWYGETVENAIMGTSTETNGNQKICEHTLTHSHTPKKKKKKEHIYTHTYTCVDARIQRKVEGIQEI